MYMFVNSFLFFPISIVVLEQVGTNKTDELQRRQPLQK